MRSQENKRKNAAAKSSQLYNRVQAQKPVTLFSHLQQYEKQSYLQANSSIPDPKTRLHQQQIHPLVMSLGLQFSEFIIAGGNARCVGMLTAFKKVIADYITPSGTMLSRHLTSYISKQVDFLSNTRSLAPSMKTAIRYLKQEISRIDISLSDEDAKKFLVEKIDTFMRDRIFLAGQAIANYAISKIEEGDVILTYAHSSVVFKLLTTAFEKKINFSVVVADGKPKYEGKALLKKLCNIGIKCTYIATNASAYIMKNVTKVILGASAILSNGAVISRVGTAVIAMAAYEEKVPVIFCCETYKFSENVRLDSFVWNEIGDPDELVPTTTRPTQTPLPSFLPPASLCQKTSGSSPYMGLSGSVPPLNSDASNPKLGGASSAQIVAQGSGRGKGKTGGSGNGGRHALLIDLSPMASPLIATAAMNAGPSSASAFNPNAYQLNYLGSSGASVVASSSLVGVNIHSAAAAGGSTALISSAKSGFLHSAAAPSATSSGVMVGATNNGAGTFIAGGGNIDQISGLVNTGPFVSASLLANWREIDPLKLLNLHYDVTPSKFIAMVISEVGLIPSTSAMTVLRDLHLSGVQ